MRIIDRVEDGRPYVEVINDRGEHLFCAGTKARAEAIINEDHAVQVAACWHDPRKAER